jgi:hypothetical protein
MVKDSVAIPPELGAPTWLRARAHSLLTVTASLGVRAFSLKGRVPREVSTSQVRMADAASAALLPLKAVELSCDGGRVAMLFGVAGGVLDTLDPRVIVHETASDTSLVYGARPLAPRGNVLKHWHANPGAAQ